MLNCVCFNARSVRNKLPEFYYLLYAENYSVIIVTETWLKAEIADNMLDPRDLYNIYRCDRSEVGGGVCILVHKSVNSTSVSNCSGVHGYELCCIELTRCNVATRLIAIYRPPGSDLECMMQLTSCLRNLIDTKGPCVITGDLNCPNIDWDTLSVSHDKVQEYFLHFALIEGLSQLVSEPTRERKILDIVMCNEPLAICNVAVEIPFSNSDHNRVEFSIFNDSSSFSNVKCKAPLKTDRRDWSKANFEGMAQYIAAIDWYGLLEINLTADSIWKAFTEIIQVAIDNNVPVKSHMPNSQQRKCKTRYPPNIRRAISKKRRLWRKRRESGTAVTSEAYCNATEKCRQLIRDFEIKKERDIIEANNAGAFFKFVNRRLSCRKGVSALRDAVGNVVANDTDRANLLNNYFCSVCNEDDGLRPPFDRRVPDAVFLDTVEFSPLKVFTAMKKLKFNKSCGPDGMPPLLIKRLSQALAEPLSLMFTSFMSIGQMPLEWAHALVTPTYKGGNASDASNYRPISLTCVACKVMERVIAADILTYLREHSIINRKQHGFLSKRSTSTNLLETMNDWSIAIRDKQSVISAYIDFAKAFDTVSHPKLYVKLQSYGISGNLLKWIISFLSNRTQQTRVGSSLSDSKAIISGIVQGSVLGPLLFVLYINDLITLLSDGECKCQLYADDLKLYTILDIDDGGEILQSKLDIVYRWSCDWQLQISYKKCCAMVVNRTQCQHKASVSLKIGTNEIVTVSEVKDLGVVIDDDLKFTSHINHVVFKASVRANLIKKCFISRDTDTMVKAFNVYVRPYLEYAACVWSPYLVGDITLIESVQRRFTRTLPGLSSLNYGERLNRLNLTSLESRRLHHDLIMTYKILFGLVDLKPEEFFTRANTVYNTRGHMHKLCVNHCRVNTRKHFFSERVVNPWNSLCATECDFSSLTAFKLLLKRSDFRNFLTFNF